MPGVVSAEDPAEGTEELWPLVEKALAEALARLLKTRQKEGAHLARDLKSRVAPCAS